MKKISVVLLDERNTQPSEIYEILQKEPGFQIEKVASRTDLLSMSPNSPCDIILTLPAETAEQGAFLQEIRKTNEHVPVIVVSNSGSVDDAVGCMRAGAFDYVEEAIPSRRFIETLMRAAKRIPPNGQPEETGGGQHAYGNIIGKSKKMCKVFSMIEKICDTDTTVLIQGESGTGKELIAQALHFQGERRHGPFIPVNCGAIPGELLESELFGHEKGAFTHAIRTRIGRFELADGGTVFLDEISEMSPMLQVKILRVLQERKFERIGGTKTITSDFRVIAATNRNLEEEVKEGRFREDLYYRLNVIPIEAPPLRERASDIPLLVDYFISKFNRSKRKDVTGFGKTALQKLQQYTWPGNVRELENIIERMVILAPGKQLVEEDLPTKINEQSGKNLGGNREYEEIPDQDFMLSKVVSNFEKRLIIMALNQTGWVKNRAAKLLNVNRTTLIEKMKRYKIVNQQQDA